MTIFLGALGQPPPPGRGGWALKFACFDILVSYPKCNPKNSQCPPRYIKETFLPNLRSGSTFLGGSVVCQSFLTGRLSRQVIGLNPATHPVPPSPPRSECRASFRQIVPAQLPSFFSLLIAFTRNTISGCVYYAHPCSSPPWVQKARHSPDCA